MLLTEAIPYLSSPTQASGLAYNGLDREAHSAAIGSGTRLLRCVHYRGTSQVAQIKETWIRPGLCFDLLSHEPEFRARPREREGGWVSRAVESVRQIFYNHGPPIKV